MVMTLTRGKKLRSSAANARYWATIQDWMELILNALVTTSLETGYTVLEVKRIVADNLPHEQAAILFVRKKEAVHDILKDCAGIPSSVRLGTKEFNEFTDELERVMAEIKGEVMAVQMKAGA